MAEKGETIYNLSSRSINSRNKKTQPKHLSFADTLRPGHAEQTYAYDALVNIAESKDPQLHDRIQTHAMQLSLAHQLPASEGLLFFRRPGKMVLRDSTCLVADIARVVVE